MVCTRFLDLFEVLCVFCVCFNHLKSKNMYEICFACGSLFLHTISRDLKLQNKYNALFARL